jgi:acyl-coenzyme A thioesterase PaaI-like protein
MPTQPAVSQPLPVPPALFQVSATGECQWDVTATELTRGPWATGVMHGGAICGLLGWAVESALQRPDLVCTRLTVEILSGIPIESFEVTATIVKGGKRTAVVESQLMHHGRMLARASSQWLLPNDDAVPPMAEVPPRPTLKADPGAHPDMEYPRPGFNADATEQRIITGSTEEPGPGLIWLQLSHPLVEGETTTPFAHIATLSDLGAAVGWDTSPDFRGDGSAASFINTDVTLQLLRRPVGNWALFESGTVQAGNGLACCRSTLHDDAGLLGWVLQSQLEAPDEVALGVLPAGR